MMLSGLSLYGDLIGLRKFAKELELIHDIILYGKWLQFLNSYPIQNTNQKETEE